MANPLTRSLSVEELRRLDDDQDQPAAVDTPPPIATRFPGGATWVDALEAPPTPGE